MRIEAAVLLFALSPAFAFAGELRFQCPERYPDKLIELAEQPQGWSGSTAFVSSGLLVSGGGMITGSPKDEPRAELRGSDVKTKDGGIETRYPVTGRENWAFCSYGQGGEIQVFRRILGGDLKECSVKSSQPKWPAPLRVQITCN